MQRLMAAAPGVQFAVARDARIVGGEVRKRHCFGRAGMSKSHLSITGGVQFCPSDANGLPQFGQDFASRETWRPQSGQGNRLGWAGPSFRFDAARTTTTMATTPATSSPKNPTMNRSSNGPIPTIPTMMLLRCLVLRDLQHDARLVFASRIDI